MPTRHKKRRIPRLLYTTSRGIGYYVTYRDSTAGYPTKHRFGMVSRDKALKVYTKGLAGHLTGEAPEPPKRTNRKIVEQIPPPKPVPIKAEIVSGSLLHITSGYLTYEESRVRPEGGERRPNTIQRREFENKRLVVQEFMKFLNSRHGQGAVGRMQLADLEMVDVESYNQLLVSTGNYSDSQVKKRMQVVKQIIDRAGRPEH